MSTPGKTDSNTPPPDGPIFKPSGSVPPELLSQGIRDRLTAKGASQQAIDAACKAALTLDANQSESAKAWFGSVIVYTWLHVQASSGPTFKAGAGGLNASVAGVSWGTLYTANGYTLAELFQNTNNFSFGSLSNWFTVEFYETTDLLGSFQGGGLPDVSAGAGEGSWT